MSNRDDQVYVQAIGIKAELPDGGKVFGKFIGLALCSPEQWEEVKKKPLGEILASDETPILFQDPEPLEKAIGSIEGGKDIIDMIRKEVKRDHHDDLVE